jgi:tRNA(Arg) A34 adenosine deaminase TadA
MAANNSKIQKRLTLSHQESEILGEICRRLGWSESKALQVMFFEFCDRRNLIIDRLHKS